MEVNFEAKVSMQKIDEKMEFLQMYEKNIKRTKTYKQ